MRKLKERAIPYRVYKKLFPDCPARDYKDGKITVEFPEDYLTSKMYTPEGWRAGNNYVNKLIGHTRGGAQVWADIAQYADGGVKYYNADVTIGNTFSGGASRGKRYIRSFSAALEWAVETAKQFVFDAGKEE